MVLMFRPDSERVIITHLVPDGIHDVSHGDWVLPRVHCAIDLQAGIQHFAFGLFWESPSVTGTYPFVANLGLAGFAAERFIFRDASLAATAGDSGLELRNNV